MVCHVLIGRIFCCLWWELQSTRMDTVHRKAKAFFKSILFGPTLAVFAFYHTSQGDLSGSISWKTEFFLVILKKRTSLSCYISKCTHKPDQAKLRSPSAFCIRSFKSVVIWDTCWSSPWRHKMKLFISNLPYRISESELMSLFSEFGEVTAINLILDQFSGNSKGFAFVEMSSRSSGQQAMEGLNNRLYKSKNLVCNEAKPQKKGKRRR